MTAASSTKAARSRVGFMINLSGLLEAAHERPALPWWSGRGVSNRRLLTGLRARQQGGPGSSGGLHPLTYGVSQQAQPDRYYLSAAAIFMSRVCGAVLAGTTPPPI